MIIRCLGWVFPQHTPIILGEKEPFDRKDFTDGMCKECEKKLEEVI